MKASRHSDQFSKASASPSFWEASVGGRRGKESSEARRVAVMARHFRCLQRKEARQTAQNAVQKGRKEKREEGRGGRARD